MPFHLLIDTSTLKTHLGEPDWVVIDCRHELTDPTAGRRAFQAGHIPKATFASLDEHLSDHHSGLPGRHPLPAPERFAAWLGSIGLTSSTQVVAYDAQGGLFAARLWWMLRWVGHEACAVLDGGLPAWLEIGGKLEAGDAQTPGIGVSAAPAQFDIRPSLVSSVDTQELINNLGTQAWTVCDARAPDRFRGENETLDPVGGHIPGAVNRFFKDNLTSNGRFKSAEALRAEFMHVLGDQPPKNVIHQCGSGVSACHNILAMEVAGLNRSRLYPGSWSAWVSDPACPVAVGA